MKNLNRIFFLVLLQCKTAVLLGQVCPFLEGPFALGGTYSGTCSLTVGPDVVISGNVIWDSGTLAVLGSAGNIRIANGGSLTINGGGIEATDDGNADGSNDGRIIVDNGGTLTLASGSTLTSYAFMTINGTAYIDGTVTLQNGRLDIGTTAVVYVQDDGVLDVNGTGDNIIAGYMNITGTFETNGDIDINGGTLEVNSEGEIRSTSGNVELDVYNGGSFGLEDGGLAIITGDVNNTDSDGCVLPTCSPGGTLNISGTLQVGDDITIISTTPESSLTSSGDTGEIQITGTFNDGECSYHADIFAFCGCNGQTNTVCSAAVLPIELIAFSGQQDGKSILLKWTTASETNNKYFSIERSTGADMFTEIIQKQGSINSHSVVEYNAHDTNPKPGKNYYRLKQVDLDNTATYAAVIRVDYEFLNSTLTIYPNPSNSGTVHLQATGLSPDRATKVIIKNIHGTIVSTLEYTTDSRGTLDEVLDVSKYPAGLYLLQSNTLQSKLVLSH